MYQGVGYILSYRMNDNHCDDDENTKKKGVCGILIYHIKI